MLQAQIGYLSEGNFWLAAFVHVRQMNPLCPLISLPIYSNNIIRIISVQIVHCRLDSCLQLFASKGAVCTELGLIFLLKRHTMKHTRTMATIRAAPSTPHMTTIRKYVLPTSKPDVGDKELKAVVGLLEIVIGDVVADIVFVLVGLLWHSLARVPGTVQLNLAASQWHPSIHSNTTY